MPSKNPDAVAMGALHALTTGDGTGIYAYRKQQDIDGLARSYQEFYKNLLSNGRGYFERNVGNVQHGKNGNYDEIVSVFKAFHADERWNLPKDINKIAFLVAISKATPSSDMSDDRLVGAEVIEFKRWSSNDQMVNYRVTLKHKDKEKFLVMQIQKMYELPNPNEGNFYFWHIDIDRDRRNRDE